MWQDTALSYSIGAAGSFLYLRLLNRTMDTLGGSGGLMAAVGQPRLLIPVILALVYNRWVYCLLHDATWPWLASHYASQFAQALSFHNIYLH